MMMFPPPFVYMAKTPDIPVNTNRDFMSLYLHFYVVNDNMSTKSWQ